MKVLHVIPAVAARYGGPSRVVFDMCRATSRDVECLIATTDADGPARLDVERGVRLTYQGVESIFFSRHFNEPFGYSGPLARWLKEHVKDFDVVHIHAIFSHSSVAASRACRRSGVPYIVRPLGSLDPWSMSQKPWRKRLLWYAGVKQMLSDASEIHYTTREEQRLAESTLGLAKGTVITIGVDAATYDAAAVPSFAETYRALSDKPYILVLSRLHQKKNLESLIEVFLKLTADFANWRLVIAGDGEPDYVARLKKLVGTSERIVFTGWLDGTLKNSALRGASLLALPSHGENFGLCVAEALACGVPVVISRYVNLAAEIGEAGAGWISGLQVSELETTLREAMNDAGERARRGKAAKEFAASRLAWPQVAAALVTLYQSVINKNTPHYAAVAAVPLTEQ